MNASETQPLLARGAKKKSPRQSTTSNSVRSAIAASLIVGCVVAVVAVSGNSFVNSSAVQSTEAATSPNVAITEKSRDAVASVGHASSHAHVVEHKSGRKEKHTIVSSSSTSTSSSSSSSHKAPKKKPIAVAAMGDEEPQGDSVDVDPHGGIAPGPEQESIEKAIHDAADKVIESHLNAEGPEAAVAIEDGLKAAMHDVVLDFMDAPAPEPSDDDYGKDDDKEHVVVSSSAHAPGPAPSSVKDNEWKKYTEKWLAYEEKADMKREHDAKAKVFGGDASSPAAAPFPYDPKDADEKKKMELMKSFYEKMIERDDAEDDKEDAAHDREMMERVKKMIEDRVDDDDDDDAAEAPEESAADAAESPMAGFKDPSSFKQEDGYFTDEVFRADISNGASDALVETILKQKAVDHGKPIDSAEVAQFNFFVGFDVVIKGADCEHMHPESINKYIVVASKLAGHPVAPQLEHVGECVNVNYHTVKFHVKIYIIRVDASTNPKAEAKPIMALFNKAAFDQYFAKVDDSVKVESVETNNVVVHGEITEKMGGGVGHASAGLGQAQLADGKVAPGGAASPKPLLHQ